MSLVLALPSKGRLKEQAEAWLADCGFALVVEGGDRGYRATLNGLPGAEVRLLSAADIAASLDAGDVHLGVTGEDLLRERGEALESRIMLLRALGFGRANLVVAAPQSWIDVETMADVADVAHLFPRAHRPAPAGGRPNTPLRPAPSSPATASANTASSTAWAPRRARPPPGRRSWWWTSPPPGRLSRPTT